MRLKSSSTFENGSQRTRRMTFLLATLRCELQRSRRNCEQLAADGDLLFGRFDLGHSVRILVNLVENAHKYAPKDTPIELSACRDGDRIDVRVADRGPGLALTESERAFEPFNRSPGLPPDVGGAGLGLAIARRLAEAQSASLRYESRAGGGSVFTYSFPAVEFTPDAG